MPKDRVSGSRVGRAGRLVGGAAGVAGRDAGARVLAKGNSELARKAAINQQIKAAESLANLFSGMRGAAMKVGQTLSAVDLGLVPPEARPKFQEILSSLQQDAEPVSLEAVSKVIEEDLGQRMGSLFSEFEERPMAAASIGQVHRATTREGRDVAVKVQYPGIAEAIHADMRNLKLGLKLLAVIAPGIDTGEIAREIRERIGEELDYELEAHNQRSMARVYRDHPFIHVPDVVGSMCGERVLVSEFVEADRYAAAKERDQAERDRFGEILVRFYINGPLRHRLLNGDPHPGNALYPREPGGPVSFLDFGFFKRMGDREVSQLIRSTRATYHEDPAALMEVINELDALPADPALAEPFFESYQSIFGWLMVDRELKADPGRTAEMMRVYTVMQGDGIFKDLKLPAEHFVLMRSVFLMLGVLGGLGSTNTWLDVIREWLLGEPPATELGRQEAEFFAGKFDYDTEVLA